MIRLTWLQFRLQAIVALVALALCGILLRITGAHLAHLYDTTVAPCAAQGDCDTAKSVFLRHQATLRQLLEPFLLIVPGLVGIFWGVPLITRELETGTFRLAWTQSVARKRWLAVKLGVLGIASAAAAGLLSQMVTWWFSPIDRVNANRFDPSVFDARGIVAIGYVAFAFMLGVTAGLLITRTLPAMAATLAVFVGGRLAVAHWMRPHFLAPVKQSLAFVWGPGAGIAQGAPGSSAFVIPPTPNLPNAWVYSNVVVDQSGHPPSSQFLQRVCPALLGDAGSSAGGSIGNARVTGAPSPVGGPTDQQVHACVTAIAARFHQVVTYQPANRYWTFQWAELGIFIGLALLLAGFSFWWVGHRLA